MARIVTNTEENGADRILPLGTIPHTRGGAITRAAAEIGDQLSAQYLVTFTESGDTARRLSRLRVSRVRRRPDRLAPPRVPQHLPRQARRRRARRRPRPPARPRRRDEQPAPARNGVRLLRTRRLHRLRRTDHPHHRRPPPHVRHRDDARRPLGRPRHRRTTPLVLHPAGHERAAPGRHRLPERPRRTTRTTLTTACRGENCSTNSGHDHDAQSEESGRPVRPPEGSRRQVRRRGKRARVTDSLG